MTYQCDDDTFPKDALMGGPWTKLFEDCAAKMNRPLNTYETMEAKIIQQGFVNVQKRTYKAPFGDWPKHPIYKEVGKLNEVHVMEAMEGYAMFLL